MVHGAVRSLFQLLGALVAGLLIALPVFAWRLNSAPIALDFLTPYIEDALAAPDGSFAVRLGATVLALRPGELMLEIRALDVRAFAGGQPVAAVPEAALSINGRALLAGIVAPSRIVLRQPRLRLVRDRSGAVQWGGGGGETGSGELLRHLEDALMGAPDPARPGRHLQVVAVRDASVQIEDQALGMVWDAPDVDAEFRRAPDGLVAEGRLELMIDGAPTTASLRAAYTRTGDQVEGELRVDNLRPAAFARLGGPARYLEAIGLPLAGTVRARGTLAGTLSSLSFDLAGGAGTLTLPEPLANRYPVTALSLRGMVEGRRLTLSELHADLGGPTATLSAVVDGLGGETVVKADGVVRNVPVDQVRHLWPVGLAANARGWVIPNLTRGVVPEARVTLSARSPSGRFDDVVLDHLGGEIRPEGVTVNYLSPMPPARNVQAVCTFDTSAFRIALKGGELFGLRLKDGVVLLTGLDKEDQFADIELLVAGPVTDALTLIDHPPLRYARQLGIEPATVGGEAVTRLRLKFPLLKTLRLDDLAVKAHASVRNAVVPSVLMGLDLTGGQLELEVDAKGLDAAGPVVLGSIPGRLQWRENFGAKAGPFRSRYQLEAAQVDEDQRRSLGLDGPPFVAPFTAGPVGAAVTATFMDGGRGEIEARVDLSAARMELPGLGWAKEPGRPAEAEVSVRLERRRLAAVPRFTVEAPGLLARGAVSFDQQGDVRRVEFAKARFGRSDGEGSITFRPGKAGMDVAFKGASFDAEPVLATDKDSEGRPVRDHKDDDRLPPMSVAASVRTLWVSGKGALTDATAALSRDARDWRSVTVKGGVGEGRSFSLAVQPASPGHRSLLVTSDDAGAVLRAFDVYRDMSGGKLSVEGLIDDTKANQPISGTIRVGDYYVRNAPWLARLLTVAALTGILDLLQGEGVGFSSLEAPFVYADGLVTVKDARAYGAALGLTGRGEIDMDGGRMALEGTVVPAYAINSVLGKIPLLGWLVTGGEKGGGIIAFNYQMKGTTEDPGVLVNPLSVLTPGFLRNLFNIFDDGTETEARKKKPATP